jgi:tetrahydromethanopterin S-methyltransferase subunit F
MELHNEAMRRIEEENNRQNHRIENLEQTVKEIGQLTTSVEKLAVSIENMVKEQARQGEKIEELESRDGKMWRQVVGYVVTTIIGIVVGFIFTHLGM